jgi:hypothetical protein
VSDPTTDPPPPSPPGPNPQPAGEEPAALDTRAAEAATIAEVGIYDSVEITALSRKDLAPVAPAPHGPKSGPQPATAAPPPAATPTPSASPSAASAAPAATPPKPAESDQPVAPSPSSASAATAAKERDKEKDREREAVPPGEPRSERDLRRRAVIRRFPRMRIGRAYPLTITLTRPGEGAPASGASVAASSATDGTPSAKLRAAGLNPIPTVSPFVRVRPVLTGCDCHPAEVIVDISASSATAAFHVVPRAAGAVPDARLEFVWRHRTVSRVDIPASVSAESGRLAGALAASAAAWPFLASAARAGSAAGASDGDPLAGAVRWLVSVPHAAAGGTFLLLAGAWVAWLWGWPTSAVEETEVLSVKPQSVSELVSAGRRAAGEERWAEAVAVFEDAVALSPNHLPAVLGLARSRRRLDGPRPSAAVLAAVRGPSAGDPEMLFEMACCHALLGERDAAFRALRTSVIQGLESPGRLLREPDLASLRTDPQFKALAVDRR